MWYIKYNVWSIRTYYIYIYMYIKLKYYSIRLLLTESAALFIQVQGMYIHTFYHTYVYRYICTLDGPMGFKELPHFI